MKLCVVIICMLVLGFLMWFVAASPMAIAAPVSVSFQIDTNLDRVMTPAQRRAFGVDRWNARQRNEFDAWLRSYALGNANALLRAANKAQQ